MYKNALVPLAVLLCVSLFSPSSHADSIRFEAFNLNSFSSVPACKPLPDGQNVVQIYLDLTASAKSVRFSAPSRSYLRYTIWEYPVVGDEGSTQTLDLGGCLNGSILLGTSTYDVLGAECEPLIGGEIVGDRTSFPIVVGCDDVERSSDPICSAAQPTLLSPVDGALNVSLTPTLTCRGSVGDFCIEGIGVYNFSLYVGTSPETLASVETWLPESTQWQLPNPLLPETTYYWRVKFTDDYWNYSGTNVRFSPIHSFTTGTPVAVEGISWSTFKRVYQE